MGRGDQVGQYPAAIRQPTSGAPVAQVTPLVDLNPRIALAVTLHQREQRRRMRRVQPDAAMRGAAAEPLDIRGSVNGKSVMEEDRVRHRRIVVFAREITSMHRLRTEYAARRAIAAAAGRDRPAVPRRAVDADSHALR